MLFPLNYFTSPTNITQAVRGPPLRRSRWQRAPQGAGLGHRSRPKWAVSTQATWALGQSLLTDRPKVSFDAWHSPNGANFGVTAVAYPAPRGTRSQVPRRQLSRPAHAPRATHGHPRHRHPARGPGEAEGPSARCPQVPLPLRGGDTYPPGTPPGRDTPSQAPPRRGAAHARRAAAGQSGVGSDGRRGAARRARRPRAGGAEEGDRAGQRLCHHHR